MRETLGVDSDRSGLGALIRLPSLSRKMIDLASEHVPQGGARINPLTEGLEILSLTLACPKLVVKSTSFTGATALFLT